MTRGNLLARLFVGNRIEVIAQDSNKGQLMVLLSSRLEREGVGTSGDIFDVSINQVVYRCCRSAY
jgi:hypothetical protein